jgi:uncharacterized coiled-coil DUF342 family protein
MGLEELARELYAGPPGEFVSRRDEQARKAKEAGDAALARELRALRRPTQSAWAANQLVAHRSELVERVLELGEAFRSGTLSRSKIQELSAQRRTLLHELTAAARELAAGAGVKLTAEMERELDGTLHAAIADAGCADELRAGRLTKPLAYTGFGPQLHIVPEPATTPRKVTKSPDKKDKDAERASAIAEAEDEVQARTEALEAATANRDGLRARRDEVAATVEELREKLSLLEKDLAAAERGVTMEQRRLERARRTLDAHRS